MGNNTNTYATINPINISMVGMQEAQENQDFRYRAEKRAVDEIDRLKKEAEDKKKQDLINSFNDIKGAAPTGIKSIDDYATTLLLQAKEKNLAIYKKELAGQPLSAEDIALKKNLQSLPDQIAHSFKVYMDENANYGKGVADKSVKRDTDYELSTLKMVNGAIPFLDSQGNIGVGVDKDGDGQPDVHTFDMNSGFSLKPRLVPNINADKLVEQFSKTVEPYTNTTDKNFVKTTKSGIRYDVAEKWAKDTVFNKDGSPSDFAISEMWDAGIKDPSQIDPAALQKLQSEMTTKALNSKASSDVKDVDYGAMNASQRLAFDKSKEVKKAELTQVAVPESFTNAGIKPAEGYKAVTVSNGKPVKELIGVDVKTGKQVKLSNAYLSAYTVEKNNQGVRSIVAEVVYQDSKSSVLSAEEELLLAAPETTENKTAKDLVLSKVNKGAENKSVIMRLVEKDGAKYADDAEVSYNELKSAARSGAEPSKIKVEY